MSWIVSVCTLVEPTVYPAPAVSVSSTVSSLSSSESSVIATGTFTLVAPDATDTEPASAV